MGGDCRDCRKWEEDIYWTHFQSVQFVQFLSGDSDLAIPKKFVNNLREKLPETVTLKGPSGATWNVGLMRSGGTLVFNHGWKEFVKDHSLEEDDVLIFKYNGDSHFDVLMFDRRSFCEKEASYFVRKCGHTDDSVCQTKKNIVVDSFEVTDGSSHGTAGWTPSKKSRKDDTPQPTPRTRQTRANGKIRKGPNNGKQISKSQIRAYPVQFVSKRRPITEEEKEKALQMAHAASTKDSFIVVMRPSHVYKGFFMSIPYEWADIRLPEKTQDLILRVKENEWRVRYYRKSCGSGLTGGWKNFVTENFLEEFDVCLFNVAVGTEDAIVLDVSIFRVVEQVIPPARVTTPSPRRGKKSKNMKRKTSEATGA